MNAWKGCLLVVVVVLLAASAAARSGEPPVAANAAVAAAARPAPNRLAKPAGLAAGATVTYHYDSLGRLVQDAYPANTLSYTYDAAGNRTQTSVQ